MTAPIDRLPWQPIETAPKDRRIILRRDSRVIMGKWNSEPYSKKPKPHWSPDKSYSVCDDRAWHPTHWLDISDKEQPE